MFENFIKLEKDPILGLVEEFKSDLRNEKMNLTTGVFNNKFSKTPIMDVVKKAERQIISTNVTKANFNMLGSVDFSQGVSKMLFDADIKSDPNLKFQIIQTLGGTGALRLAADILKCHGNISNIWISNPTWENHKDIFLTAGVKIKEYEYLCPVKRKINLSKILQDLSKAQIGDAILLQACCHNPTGFDFTKEEWEQLAIFCKEKKLFPIFDAAYLGLSESIDKDKVGIEIFLERFHEVLIANSFSKNLSLYDERIGALTIISKSQSDLDNLMSQVCKIIRSMYSIPPLHGALIVSEILNNSDLDFEWKQELSQMRDHLNEVKIAFKAEIEKYGIANKFYLDFDTHGMFIYSDLSPIQIEKLKEKFGIYILKSGRISLAGISLSKLDFLCSSLYNVVKSEN